MKIGNKFNGYVISSKSFEITIELFVMACTHNMSMNYNFKLHDVWKHVYPIWNIFFP